MLHSAENLPDPELQPEYYADVLGKRLFAWVVDSILLLLLTAMVILFTLFTALIALPVVFIAVNLAYRTVTLARYGATPGMLLTGIELRDARGRRPDPVTALLHTAGFVVASGFIIPQIASIALMLVTARRQGLLDLLLGSTVINRPGAT